MIVFKDVTKKYGSSNEPVLENINFLIDKGSFVYLVGPTGSGKTTVFRLIIRDLFPTEGQITLWEWNLTTLPKSKIPTLRRKVGVVFQDLKLLMDRTVIENVMLPLQLSGINEKESRSKSEEILIDVGLEEKLDKFPLQLSGGERQRVAIARALVFDPEIILADEPTGNLDTQSSFQILDLLKSINKRGTTIFMATHSDELVDSSSDRVIMLARGKIVEDKKSASKSEEDKNERSEKKSKPKPDVAELKNKIKLETLARKEGSKNAS